MSFEVIDDADTGNEILWFMRRGRPYLYLRDRDTKAFVRRLIGVEFRLFMVVDYDVTRAKKGNPLYIDATTVMALSPETFEVKEEKEEVLESLCVGKVSEYFGHYVSDEILDLSGLEYGSEVRKEFLSTEVIIRRKRLITIEVANEIIYYWSLVWKHHKELEGKSEEGYETL